jgi:hypothetical protein
MLMALRQLRAHSPETFAEIARALDSKIHELLAVCRDLEGGLRESGDIEAADLLGVMVLEWETAFDLPALVFPFLMEPGAPAN